MVTSRKTNGGLNAVRDFLDSEITDLAVGDDGTDPSVTDTALGNELLEKSASSTTGADGVVTHTIRLLASELNGQTIREIGSKNSGGTLEDRLVFADQDKNNNFELEFRLTQTVQNP